MIKLQQVDYANGSTGWDVVLDGRYPERIATIHRRGSEYVPSLGRKGFPTLREAAIHAVTLKLRALKTEAIVAENVRLAIEEGRFAVLPPPWDRAAARGGGR